MMIILSLNVNFRFVYRLEVHFTCFRWSYGVVLWEIVTLGSIPYQGMDGMEVVRYIKNGNRMGKPKHCSPEL